MDYIPIIIASLAALVAGFVDAVAGGGGVITFPTLLMLGLPVSQIVGTNKFVSTCGTSAATYTFWRNGFISREVGVRAVPVVVVGSLLGAYLVLALPNDFLRPLAGTLTLAIALYAFFRPKLGAEHGYQGLTAPLTVKLLLAALIIGFYDGFFGPGTGMFLTLFFVRVLKMDFVNAAGNTKLLNLVSNVVPLTYFLFSGVVLFNYAVPMAVGNLIGGYLGAHAAVKVGPQLVRWIFIIMAAALSIKLMIEQF